MIPYISNSATTCASNNAIGRIPPNGRIKEQTKRQRVLKRVFDIVCSMLLLAITRPLMLLDALVIKLDSPGPVFFVQERVGMRGQCFNIIKFRSMFYRSEAHWQKVAQRDEQGRLIYKRRDDPRVTYAGRILRRSSLDELPQLFNVLRGDMSWSGHDQNCHTL